MSLVSNLFLLFVAASVLVYYIVPHKFQWIVLLVFSYIYYIAGGPRYVVFILFPILTEIFRVFHIFTEIYSFFHPGYLADGASYRKNRREGRS